MKKRLFSILLAALMVVSLLPAMAWATPEGSAITDAATELTGGSYYLSCNVTLQGNLIVSGDATLDLNGYVLAGNGESNVITVQSGKTLTLKDSNTGSQTHKFTVDDDGLWTLDEDATENYEIVTGGVITGGSHTWGGGVYVDGGTLTMNGGNIVGNKAPSGYGGGVYINNGTLTMDGGSIVGNTATSSGGGVNVFSGTFTMNGGTISGNTATSSGGGVYVNGGTFTMSEGTISGNEATLGGGVYNSNTFTMSGGEITGNTATNKGGGVYNSGTFTMSGGEITGNKADGDGGGVCSVKPFTMSGGTIVGNNAQNGGGVYINVMSSGVSGVPDDEFAITGGNITGNEATLGGGVFVEGNGTVKLGGGTITKNVAVSGDGSNGGGVFANPYNTKVFLGGGVQITDNLLETDYNEVTGEYTTVANNLYLLFVTEGGTVKLGNGTDTGAGNNGVAVPGDGMKVGVTLGEGTPSEIFTDSDTDAAYFFSDNDSYYVAKTDSKLSLAEVGENTVLNVTKGTASADLPTAISTAIAGETLKLLDNVETNTMIQIDKNLTLDLNGKVLKGTGMTSVINVNSGSNLTLTDSAPTAKHSDNTLPAGGVITGGTASNSYGGAVCVGNEENPYTPSGTFTMNGGTICGCQATSSEYDSENSRRGRGGAIYIYANGTFNMNGGAIKDCSASVAGGAIFNIGKVNITGGKITGCFVSGMEDAGVIKAKGGAVYNYGGSQFTMTGGEISGNTLGDVYDQRGAGVYVAQNANVTLGGTAKITGNTKSDGIANNLFLYNNTTVTIGADEKAPAPGMVIGVTTQTAPTGGDPVAVTTANGESATMYFHSDNDAYTTVYSNSGSGGVMDLILITQLDGYSDSATKVVNVGERKAYDTLSAAIADNSPDNYYIRLLNNVTENISIADKEITLDLNGHVLNGTGSGSVITVNSDKTLTLIDTNPTAVHKGDLSGDGYFWTWDGGADTGDTEIKGGIITGGEDVSEGGGVNVTGNACFKMYGGTIAGNTADGAKKQGGGVCVGSESTPGNFELHSGTIAYCTAKYGGGVYIHQGSFTMNGGSMEYCGGILGGGTMHTGGLDIGKKNPTVVLTGGRIVNNIGDKVVGGVIFESGTLTLGGTITIKDNKVADGSDGNLYLGGNKAAISTETLPADGFSVGVITPVPTAEKPRVAFTSNGIAAEKYGFFSDQGHKTVFEPAHLEFAYIGEPETPVTPPSDGGDSTSAYTVPVSGDKTSVKIKATVSGSNATIKNVTSEEIEIIGTGANVVVDLSGVSKSVTAVTIPKTTFENVAASDADGLEVDFPNGTVAVFDQKTVQAVKEQAAGNDIKLVVDRERKAEQSMTSAQKEVLKALNKPVALDAYFVSGGKRISDFKGGEAELTAVYQTTAPVRVWYITEDGLKELIPSTYDGKTASFVVNHFSHYVIEQLDGSTYAACPQDETCVYAYFADADPKEWYHSGVHFCVENAYMLGVAENTFEPGGALSRGMIVTMLWRMEGSPAANYAMTFKDVEAGRWYTEAIRWAQSTGVVKGYNEDSFGPDDNVTREQLAAMLMRYAGFKGTDVSIRADLLKFTDKGKISDWALENVKWANAAGIIGGRSETEIAPLDNASRAEAACMIQRFCENILK